MDTQTTEHIQKSEQTPISQVQPAKPVTTTTVLAASLVISFIAGAAGGSLGFYYALKNPKFVQRLGGGSVSASNQVRVEEDSAVIDVVKRASPAVVSIVISKDINKASGSRQTPFNDPFFDFFGLQSPNQTPSEPNIQQVGAGSGFFISTDGMILTNRHVVSDEAASYTIVTNEGLEYEAKVLARDPVNDLALLKVEIQNAPTLTMADTSDIQIGSRVIAIGNSLGQYQNTVTTGVVSGIGRSISAGGGGVATEQLEGVIQTDAAINPGNSGGPLLNVLGQVIGINTAVDQQGQLVGFAIPANDARRAVESYRKNGKIARPYLGVRYVIVSKALAEKEKLGRDYGALIVPGVNQNEPAVIPDSPASKAGLAENDILLEINGKRIDQDSTVTKVLKDITPGETVEIKVFRDGNERTLQLTVGER